MRDRIKAKIEGNREACEIRTITDDAEFEQELLKKVAEESRAIAHVRSREEFLEEYADLMVALDALTAVLEISPAEIQVALKENIDKKGVYQARHFLSWSSAGRYESNETPQGLSSS